MRVWNGKEKTQKDSHLRTFHLLSLPSLPFSHFPLSNSAGTVPPEIPAWLPLNLLQDFIQMSPLKGDLFQNSYPRPSLGSVPPSLLYFFPEKSPNLIKSAQAAVANTAHWMA